MSELFDDDEKAIIGEDDLIEEEIVHAPRVKAQASDARRRLEALMEEKRLQNELDDWS